MLFIEYPKCSTCKKAKKFLEDNNITYNDRNIKEDKPNKQELKDFIKKSDKDINNLFNTSGILYREKDLKNKLKTISFEEKIELLSTDGMLVKRPILVTDKKVLIGFNEEEWKKNIL